MAQVFEMIMLICFGLSWPFNIAKSIRSRTAKGKSIWFEVCIIVGYLCGLAGKFISGNVTYVAAFYILDIAMVTTDLVLTMRNKRLDRAHENRAGYNGDEHLEGVERQKDRNDHGDNVGGGDRGVQRRDDDVHGAGCRDRDHGADDHADKRTCVREVGILLAGAGDDARRNDDRAGGQHAHDHAPRIPEDARQPRDDGDGSAELRPEAERGEQADQTGRIELEPRCRREDRDLNKAHHKRGRGKKRGQGDFAITGSIHGSLRFSSPDSNRRPRSLTGSAACAVCGLRPGAVCAPSSPPVGNFTPPRNAPNHRTRRYSVNRSLQSFRQVKAPRAVCGATGGCPRRASRSASSRPARRSALCGGVPVRAGATGACGTMGPKT